MDGSCLLTFVLEGEPLINTAIDTERGQLDLCRSNVVTGRDIFIPYRDFHVVTEIFDVDVEGLVPFWRLSSAVQCISFDLLHSCFNDAIWVHFAKR